ncbi:MAG: hypothetical protein ABIG28_02505, partial [archaeon]
GDMTAPVIGNILVDDGSLYAEVTDNVAVDNVQLRLTGPGYAAVPSASVESISGGMSVSYNPPTLAIGEYTYTLTGWDGVNNYVIDTVGFMVLNETPSTPLPEPNAMKKNRYISFIPGNVGRDVALRVSFEGGYAWVGPPEVISENSGNKDPVTGFDNFRAAKLQCTPYNMSNWGDEVLHVYGNLVVPDMVYSVDVFSLDTGFSEPLIVETAKWADVVGPVEDGEWTAPDGVVDISDVVALLDKFSNLPNAISKTRADLAVADLGELGHTIDIVEVILALDAFRGLGYPYEAIDCGFTVGGAVAEKSSAVYPSSFLTEEEAVVAARDLLGCGADANYLVDLVVDGTDVNYLVMMGGTTVLVDSETGTATDTEKTSDTESCEVVVEPPTRRGGDRDIMLAPQSPWSRFVNWFKGLFGG